MKRSQIAIGCSLLLVACSPESHTKEGEEESDSDQAQWTANSTAALDGQKYEAETANLTNATVAEESGASAGRFVDGRSGARMSFSPTVGSAGKYELEVRLRSPDRTTRRSGVFVNGTKVGVAATTAAKPGWAAAHFEVSLSEGTNRIELTDSENTEEIDLDYISLQPLALPDPPAPPAPTFPLRLEAERAILTQGTVVREANASAGRFVDGQQGAVQSFQLGAIMAGDYRLTARLRSPDQSRRRTGVFLNGQKIATMTSTQRRPAWGDETVTVKIPSGSSTIELRDSENTDEVDLDFVELSPIRVDDDTPDEDPETPSEGRFGDPGWELDESLLDENYPGMHELASAGVRGGIPMRSAPAKREVTVSPGDSLADAVEDLHRDGGGIVHLEAGRYVLTETLEIPAGVVLRGASTDGVVIASALREPSSRNKKNIIVFRDAEQSGLEDLTVLFEASAGDEPIERTTYTSGWCRECWDRRFPNYYVRGVAFLGSHDCWMDGVKVLRSGTDPILIAPDSSHVTLRSVVVDQAFNKGGGGNGYLDVRGDYNLIVHSRIARIRHLALQLGAKFNVVIQNSLEVDVNFHQGDEGFNLVQGNDISIPGWRGWSFFGTGDPDQHDEAGDENWLFANTTRGGRIRSVWGGTDQVYTTDGFEIVPLDRQVPASGTLYPVVYRP